MAWFVGGTDERPGLDWSQLGRGTWETEWLLNLHLQDLRYSDKELGFFILQGVRVSLQGSYWERVGEFKQEYAGSDTHLGKLFVSCVNGVVFVIENKFERGR